MWEQNVVQFSFRVALTIAGQALRDDSGLGKKNMYLLHQWIACLNRFKQLVEAASTVSTSIIEVLLINPRDFRVLA